MTRCAACHGPIGAAENPHSFGDRVHYHPGCCPMCTAEDPRVSAGVAEPALVDRLKRGHGRGTPRAWALRGVGG